MRRDGGGRRWVAGLRAAGPRLLSGRLTAAKSRVVAAVWSRRGVQVAGAVALTSVLVAGSVAGTGVTALGQVTGGVRIMPLGDSITDGFNEPGGYRIGLWRSLAALGHPVDFVGSQANGPGDLPDHDHEGHPGWRIDQIDEKVTEWVAAAAPRTVLVHIGTNDVMQKADLPRAPARLSALIDHVRAAAPEAEIFVASITPLGDAPLEDAVRAFNAHVPGIVAAKGARTHFVDMHAALTAADLADAIHPTPGGYDKMAAAWVKALAAVPGSAGDDGNGVLLATGAFVSLRVMTPGLTNRYARHQDGLGYTAVVDRRSPAPLREDATWKVVPGLAGACYSLQSRDDPGSYLRHQDGRVRVATDDGSALTRADATWCARKGLGGGVRLLSYNVAGAYLRHIGGELWLARPGGSNGQDDPVNIAWDITWSLDTPWA